MTKETVTRWDWWLRIFYYVTTGVLTAGLLMGAAEATLDIYQVWIGAAMFAGVYMINKFTKA